MFEARHGARALTFAGLLLLGISQGAVCMAQPAPQEVGEAAEGAPALDILNAGYPLAGVLTGGQPTGEQLAQAAEAGYRTIVNLRSEQETADGEEEAEVEKLGMRYLAIPIAGPEDLTGENAQALAEVLADETAYPVLLHCASSNRVGALLALKAAYFDGKEAGEALALGIEAGLTKLEPAVRELLGLPVRDRE